MGRQQPFLVSRAIKPHAQPFAKNQGIARLGAAVAAQIAWIDEADNHQPINWLDRIDRMSAGNRNTRRRAYAFTAFKNASNGLHGQGIDRHPDDGQGKQRRSTHGVNIGNRVGRRDAPKVERIVDDGHEKIGRRDDRLLFIDLIDRRIVAGFNPDQKLRRNKLRRRLGQDLFKYARGNLAATTAAMRELGQPDRPFRSGR